MRCHYNDRSARTLMQVMTLVGEEHTTSDQACTSTVIFPLFMLLYC